MADKMTLAEREIREKRAKVWDGMRAIMEKLQTGVELSVEDRSEFDKRNKKLSALDADLERVQQYNRVSEAREEAKDVRGEVREHQTDEERAYEVAFLKYMQFGNDAVMTDEERNAWRMFSNSGSIARPVSTRNYQYGKDSHGVEQRMGYTGLTTRDVVWSAAEERATLDSNALSTSPNSAGVAAGATGYNAGYLIPQGSNLS